MRYLEPEPETHLTPYPEPTAGLDPHRPAETAAETAAGPGEREHRARRAFRRWRRSRPFWGGLFVVLGGTEITITEKAPFEVVVHVGLYGLAGYLLPLILVLCGALILFKAPHSARLAVLRRVTAGRRLRLDRLPVLHRARIRVLRPRLSVSALRRLVLRPSAFPRAAMY
ncbi:MAG TPA: DUF6114 domain-containing protein [Actinocrinis sp.]|nr:DUF6114 domain-containing protein [Actinocrinis sp.]